MYSQPDTARPHVIWCSIIDYCYSNACQIFTHSHTGNPQWGGGYSQSRQTKDVPNPFANSRYRQMVPLGAIQDLLPSVQDLDDHCVNMFLTTDRGHIQQRNDESHDF